MKYSLYLFSLIAFLGGPLSAQSPDAGIRLESGPLSRAEAFRRIETAAGVRIFWQAEQLPEGTVSLSLSDATPREALEAVLEGTDLSFVPYRDVYVVGPKTVIGTEFDAAYYAAVAEQIDAEQAAEADRGPATVGSFETLGADGAARLTGTVTDGADPIIGATIQVEDNPTATTTDAEGHYALDLPPGAYRLLIGYVGYGRQERDIRLNGSGTYDINLDAAATDLQQVVVTEQAADVNVGRVQAGVQRLDLGQLEKLPTFMGETDVVKALLLNPGVSTIGEGATGFNVRGGEIDQNLLLQDYGVLLNSSHALGFFSTYNADLLKSVDLYKANMPARFGGRLASVLDVQQRDGNFDHLRVKAGIGPVTGRVMLEGPLAKNKSSFIAGVRSSYTGWVLGLSNQDNVKNSSAFFVDGNLRLTQRIGEAGTLSLSGYGSEDRFTYNNTFGFRYRTLLGQGEYNHIFSDRFYGRIGVAYSQYDSEQTDLGALTGEVLATGVNYLIVKPHLTYAVSDDVQLSGGLEIDRYVVNPGERTPQGEESVVQTRSLSDETGVESSAFAEADVRVSERFGFRAGLRYTNYRFLGAQTVTEYTDGIPRLGNETGTVEYGEGETIADYSHLQPRLSARYRVGRTGSLRAGYSRTVQYLNQIYLSASPTPNSQFQLSTGYIPPFLSHNVSLGYFLNLDNNNVELGAELYAREIDQLWDYRDFADVTVNPQLETEIRVGEGRAYGLELSGKKKVGQINGLVSYTLSRTERRVPGINAGNYYPSNFDKPHNLVLTLNWNPNQRNTLTANFTYGTGRPITAPVGNYRVDNGLLVPVYSDRNSVRIPDYHRLDLAYTLGKSYNEKQTLQTSWTVSIYNVYARKNAFSVYYTQTPDQTNVANRLAVLGTVFPAITLNIETR
ncbi:TonB-dependent receptor [Lewinella sp. IMCC34183]|uniref:TonB-dependent receptor n=1 Tax=Lewinella sp. IMCC34183 TaxID=2248762 RepID=UPI001300AB44|nr:TonB-dependent receptor [Lewinella sp. IMCC34183]